jgi:hypothetical protein
MGQDYPLLAMLADYCGHKDSPIRKASAKVTTNIQVKKHMFVNLGLAKTIPANTARKHSIVNTANPNNSILPSSYQESQAYPKAHFQAKHQSCRGCLILALILRPTYFTHNPAENQG